MQHNMQLRETWEAIFGQRGDEAEADNPQRALLYPFNGSAHATTSSISPIFDDALLYTVLMNGSPDISSASSVGIHTPLDTQYPLLDEESPVPQLSHSHNTGNVVDESMDFLFQDSHHQAALTAMVDVTPTATTASIQANHLLANSFLHSSQAHLHVALSEILQSDWYRDHVMEPTRNDDGRSIYHQFLTRPVGSSDYCCLFDGCNFFSDRQDRALGHIRTHIQHRPFVCHGECGNRACQERFCCQSYLRTHTTRRKIICNDCQSPMYPQNMKRHKTTCPGTRSTNYE